MSYVEMKDNSRVHPIHVEHGGRVYEAARRWGVEPHEVLDFSANINPLGPPQTVLSAIENALTPTSLRVYPDAHAFLSAIVNKHLLMPDGWDQINAIRNNHIYEVKSAYILQPGPAALTEGLRQLHAILAHAVNQQIEQGLLPKEKTDAALGLPPSDKPVRHAAV